MPKNNQWAAVLTRLMNREVPVYIHLAASKNGEPPFTCRGYGVCVDERDGRIRVAVLASQWRRLREYGGDRQKLAVLATAGTDNESYQIKGGLVECREIAEEDRNVLERQRALTARHFPGLLPLVNVRSADCVALGLRVDRVFVQTPGPLAGSPL
ncbi:hypothetical protein [Paenibacillus flagellatus]|uniref:hypothetical protein n=1 Tax=Paenibacillus flagellatus TaxID=2211139 RepID=UPI0013051E1F|nr:hypothetical protein [Paenibacillus flagellatus]